MAKTQLAEANKDLDSNKRVGSDSPSPNSKRTRTSEFPASETTAFSPQGRLSNAKIHSFDFNQAFLDALGYHELQSDYNESKGILLSKISGFILAKVSGSSSVKIQKKSKAFKSSLKAAIERSMRYSQVQLVSGFGGLAPNSSYRLTNYSREEEKEKLYEEEEQEHETKLATKKPLDQRKNKNVLQNSSRLSQSSKVINKNTVEWTIYRNRVISMQEREHLQMKNSFAKKNDRDPEMIKRGKQFLEDMIPADGFPKPSKIEKRRFLDTSLETFGSEDKENYVNQENEIPLYMRN